MINAAKDRWSDLEVPGQDSYVVIVQTARAAVREIDLRKKFHLQATTLADKVGLTPPKAKVLRVHLGIDEDPSCIHVFEFGSQKIPCFSDNAVAKMKAALAEVDINELWANRKNPPNPIPAAA